MIALNRPGDADGEPRVATDVRLAGVAAGAWLAALAALHLTWRAGVVVAVAAACVGALAALTLARRSQVGGWAVVSLLVGAFVGAGATAPRVAVRDAAPLAELARSRANVTVELVVTDDPRPVRGAVGRPPAYLVPADLTRVEAPPRPPLRLVVRVLVLAADAGWQPLLPGQRVATAARVGASRGGDLRAAVLSATRRPRLLGRAPWAQLAAGGLRAGLRRACEPLPREPGGLLPGLVVGDTGRLEPAVADDFRATGMPHLLAVSGSNVAIVVGFVLILTRWCRAGPRLSAALCVLALIGFVILVRPSPSVLRAAAMGGLGLMALAAGRPRSAVPALAAVVIALVTVDPELAGAPGFALSVLATAGLLLLAPRWRDVLRRRGVPGVLADAVTVPAAAQLACAPVIAALSGTVGLVAVPANLVAVPAVAPATVLGVGAALLSPVWPTGAYAAAWLAAWPARWLVFVARCGARAPGGVAPWPAGTVGGLLLAAVIVALLCAARHRVVRKVAAVVVAAVVVGTAPVRLVVPGWPPPGWLIVVCDVGQGDAAILPVAAGQAIVVDAGPEPAAVDRCLRRMGVTHVPLLVVSHFHADHVGGLEGVFRDRSVGAVLVPSHPEPTAGRRQVHAAAAARRLRIDVAVPGATYPLGTSRLSVLAPLRPLSGTRSDPNNNSLVLRVAVRRHVVLLAGDAEDAEQSTLLQTGHPVRADVLKVAHHGSAFQSVEFVDAVDPAVALVSVGAGNGYGHPNPNLLDRLSRGGARVLRTDLAGDLAAVDAGGGLAVVMAGPARRSGKGPKE